tara:strand:- start:3292 stop:4200 length:909 start_codon:yes stop_codon:yes gene_type:complete
MKNFKEVYELGTDEYTKHVKKMTPGQNEGYEGEVTKILSKKGIDGYFKNGKLMVSKRDKDAAMKALKKKSHKVDMPTIQVESDHVTQYGNHWEEAADNGYIGEKKRGPTGIAYSTNPIHLKDISKMLKDRKFKGNTSGLMKAVKAKYPDAYDDPKVQDAFKKHAETNENRLKRMTPIQRAALAKAKAAPKDKVSLPKMPFNIGNKKKEKPKVGRGSQIVRYEEYENIEEATNWKGTDNISLTRYSARKGYGLQLTQKKPMDGDKTRFTGAYVNMPMKDVPKLIKALQTVFKAPAGTQLGDDE